VTIPARILARVPAESALVVPVDDAEPIVSHMRWLHDPVARCGVPAHITLLYPFLPPSRVLNEIDALARLFAAVPGFAFSLTGVRRFPATAYLHPDPPDGFVELTEMIERHWPEFPPYRGAFSTVIPHLTVADHAGTDVLDDVERMVSIHLPLECRATSAWLLCSDEQGWWSRSHVFPFGKPPEVAHNRWSFSNVVRTPGRKLLTADHANGLVQGKFEESILTFNSGLHDS
jgi:2'-5' RNA ligase